MADLTFQAEKFYSPPLKGWRWTGYAYDDNGRIVVSDGPHRSRDAAIKGVRQIAEAKYGWAA